MGIRSQNNPIASYLDVFSKTGLDAVTAASSDPIGHTASGGVISDYTDGPAVYRAHIFTSSGTFTVSSVGEIDNQVDFLVIGGGGGGAGDGMGTLSGAGFSKVALISEPYKN